MQERELVALAGLLGVVVAGDEKVHARAREERTQRVGLRLHLAYTVAAFRDGVQRDVSEDYAHARSARFGAGQRAAQPCELRAARMRTTPQ